MTLSAAAATGACVPEPTFKVTTPVDGAAGSLRAAIDEANRFSGTDGALRIEVPSGTYELTICGEDETNAAGDLDIITNRQVNIVASDGGVVIRQSCAGQRVLDARGSGLLSLVGVTITGGNVIASLTGYSVHAQGGGVQTQGDLVLDRATVTGNSVTADSGGQAFGGGVFVGGALVAKNSTLSSNTARGGTGERATAGAAGGNAEGGGAWVAGAIWMQGGSVWGNRALGGDGDSDGYLPGHGGATRGGGVAQGFVGEVTLVACRFEDNVAQGGKAGTGGTGPWPQVTGRADATGGAVATSGPTEARQVVMSNNKVLSGDTASCHNCPGTTGRGAALAAAGRATVTASTFALNQAVSGEQRLCRTTTVPNPDYPGFERCLQFVIELGTMPGFCQLGPTLTVTECEPAAFGQGLGAIWSGGELTLVNTTMSGVGTAVAAHSLAMDHATIVGTPSGAAELLVLEQLRTHRSAVVGNGVTLCRSGVSYRESSYNRFSDASCSLNGPGDAQSSVNFALSAVADNGGPVQTMLPGASSGLIDAIPVAACTLNADARGVSRPQGSGCDVGAVEVAR